MKSIQERALENGGTVVVELSVNSFIAGSLLPKVGDKLCTEYGLNVTVVEVSYYNDSELAIIRLKM